MLHDIEQLIKKFLDTGERYAQVIDLPEDEEFMKVYGRFKTFERRRREYNVKARRRNGKLYLERMPGKARK